MTLRIVMKYYRLSHYVVVSDLDCDVSTFSTQSKRLNPCAK